MSIASTWETTLDKTKGQIHCTTHQIWNTNDDLADALVQLQELVGTRPWPRTKWMPILSGTWTPPAQPKVRSGIGLAVEWEEDGARTVSLGLPEWMGNAWGPEDGPEVHGAEDEAWAWIGSQLQAEPLDLVVTH